MINIRLSIFSITVFSLANLFGGVVCTPQLDGSWICSGDGGASVGGSVVTNVVGVCTNCTAMTPEECQSIYNQIQSELYGGMQTLTYSQQEVNYSLEAINAVLQQGDSFTPVQSWGSGSDVTSAPQIGYYTPYDLASYPDEQLGGTAVNSIANYYQSAVKPPLESAKTHLEESLVGIRSSYDTMNNLQQNVVSQIDCTACTASFGGDPVVTNSPPSSGSACPCDEQLKALHKLVKDEFLPRIKSIDANVKMLTNIVTIALNQFEVVKEGMHNISNLLVRLDDYVLDDFSNKVFQIRYDVNFIASNLAQRVEQTESFISTNYWNAVHYLDNDEQPVKMASLHDKLIDNGNTEGKIFDFGEFRKLPWFTRIEFLLLNLNGFFAYTNQTANSGVSSAEENKKEIENSSSSFVDGVNTGAKSGFDRVSNSFSSFFNSFNTAVSSSGQQVNEIQLMSNFLGDQPLIMSVDPDVTDAARTITSLLWTVLFSFVLFKIIFYFWIVFSDMIRWWIDQTQGFVK